MPLQLVERKGAIAFGSSAGSRTLAAVLATENQVNVFDRRTGSVVLEVLLISGVIVPRHVPLLTDHDRSVTNMAGSVQDIRTEGGELLGSLEFANNTEAGEEGWQLASQRHLRGVSVGYRIIEMREVFAGQAATINGRIFVAPTNRDLRVVTRWELREVSLVTIPADNAAMIRSANSEVGEEGATMPIQSVRTRDLESMPLTEIMLEVLVESGRDYWEVRQNEWESLRDGFSNVLGVETLASAVGARIISGFRSSRNSLEGVLGEVDLASYRNENPVAYANVPVRLSTVGRGETAAHAQIGFAEQGVRVMRFGCQFQIDEQDAINGITIGLLANVLVQMGAAPKRLLGDMVYSLILENPELRDGVNLFHADRGNLAAAALDETSLDAALQAIAEQTLEDGEGNPIHLGLLPKFLVVPPAKYGSARRLVRAMGLADGNDLMVRADSRLTNIGHVDPRNGELIAGNGTNWLLAASAAEAPSIAIATLRGRTEPILDSGSLPAGKGWGVWFALKYDVGAVAIAGEGLYFSTGAG